MSDLLKYLPNLARPGNEWMSLILMGAGLVAVLIDVFSDVDYTSPEGVVAALLLVPSALAARWKSYGAETFAEAAESDGV